jgi:putative tryptophan/tyrosine transport system substrate-binding protein
MIAEVIASKPALIVSQGGVGPLLSRLNSTPVVFGYSGDPVAAGMVQSLSRPGGHMTGISYMALELVGKRIELLREVLPSARRVACVSSPQHPGDDSERRASQEAASKLGIGLEYFALSGSSGLDAVLPAVEKARVQAAVMFPTQNVINASGRIAAWSVKARVPMISGWAQFADRGNFMSYGPNLRTTSRRLAFFVDRVLKGTKPAELPVELPTQVELVINARTARALGIVVPPGVLLRADRVIE